MKEAIQIFQLVVSVLLILSILSQQRSAGLSATFGGGGGGFHVSKRGAEKILFRMTIIFAILFVGSSVMYLFV
ncbi:preprotein translocase subunit SecG [bacterium]|nr:preprotein translocase subunit SecG [bacterium]